MYVPLPSPIPTCRLTPTPSPVVGVAHSSALQPDKLCSCNVDWHAPHVDREGQAAQLQEEQRLGMVPALAPSTKVVTPAPPSATSSTNTGKGAGRIVFLVDNGSVRAAATLSLRSLASSLQDHLRDGTTVVGVSARWSDRVRLEQNHCIAVGFTRTVFVLCMCGLES